MLNHRLPISIALTCLVSTHSLAFESTKVLPKGIRNFNLRTVYTETNSKTDSNGNTEPLAENLWKPLKFKNILSSEKGLKKKQLQALLIQQGWSEEDSVGDFYAELDAQINVWAPIFAFGISKNLTLAAALPIYSASTDISVGFKSNKGAEKFISALTEPTMSNHKSAIEAAGKLLNAPERLNTKLNDNGYDSLSTWNDSGVGDLTFLAKYLAYSGEVFKTAISTGFTAPTGKTEKPSVLTDLPFGDGQWDLITQLTFDQILSSSLVLNQFAKYTYQMEGEKDVRLKTEAESIEVDLVKLNYKLGDKIDAGISLQYEQASSGFQAGLGLVAYRKFGDKYKTSNLEAKKELQKNTDHSAYYWSTKLGYSTLGAYQRGEFAAPLMASIEYRKQQKSENVPKTDFTQVDIRLFF